MIIGGHQKGKKSDKTEKNFHINIGVCAMTSAKLAVASKIGYCGALA